MADWNDAAQEFAAYVTRADESATAVVREAGQEIMDDWRENAHRTSGRAAKWYVPSIQARSRRTGLLRYEAEVGPIGPGGGVGFEFGSRNQPPHLDGQKAAQVAEVEFPKSVNDWLEGLLK